MAGTAMKMSAMETVERMISATVIIKKQMTLMMRSETNNRM